MEIYRGLAAHRSDFYGLLSSIYIQIPSRNSIELLWKPATSILEYPQEGTEEALKAIGAGLRFIRTYGTDKHGISDQILIGLSKDWTHLFRGVDLKGPLPPYESLFVTGRFQSEPSQQIHRLFSGMGIRIPEEWHQPPDYIGVELDFIRLLCEKELSAWKWKQGDSLKEVVEMERSFLENHLSTWVPDFCEKMQAQACEDFYRGVALLTKGLIKYDAVYLSRLTQEILQTKGAS